MFTVAKTLSRNISQYIDLKYLLKFLILFLLLYFFNMAFLSLSTPYGNYHSSFLENNLNYIAWLRMSIIALANEMTQLMGIDSFSPSSYRLNAVNGTSMIVGDSCLGLGVMSFWMAFVIADKNQWKIKLLWCLGGLVAIWLINCLRVAFMLLAFEKDWKLVITTDYHTSFNVIAYGFV
ncbi:MAG: hypothetical protein ACXWV3_08150, partial [Flavisolibacter sp.]